MNPKIKEAFRVFAPELAESKDERIRKHIIEILKRLMPCHFDGNERSECIAYLEKQKEQKPIISEDALRDGAIKFGITQYQIDNWLKKYVNIVKEQKPAEWSEEDEQHREWILECLASGEQKVPEYADQYRSAFNWLKSLRPQPHWKPSKEQMDALNTIILTGSLSYSSQCNYLLSLRDDLKKLM